MHNALITHGARLYWATALLAAHARLDNIRSLLGRLPGVTAYHEHEAWLDVLEARHELARV